MSDWKYVRLTGKKGDSGSELLALYSAQNTVRPENDPQGNYWHQDILSTDYYMCTKVNNTESQWGSIVKIRAEQLEIMYSQTGEGNPITQPTLWHFPFANGDKYIIQRMDNGFWGTSAKFIGDDGENAVVITSLNPANPQGAFIGQVGNYNGVLYQWKNNTWTRTDSVTQTELSSAQSTAISTATSNIATYTPRYIGAFSSAPTVSSYNKGDAYLNTTNSKLYIKGDSSWTEQSAVNESNRNMFNLAMKDLLNLAGATGVVESYATAFIQNLFADKASINELQSMSVLFKEYCGSITSQNSNIGDTMIYMGKNPRLSSVTREFQFAISEYLGKVGQQEMWSDKLITKILASGILALSVMGCVQATDGVYSGVYLQKTNIEQKNIRYLIGSPIGEWVGGVVVQDGTDGVFYMTKNWLYYEEVYTINDFIECQIFKDFLYIITKTKLYKTKDFSTVTQVSSIGYSGQYYNKITSWQKNGLLLVLTINNKIYYSQDGENWNSLETTTALTFGVVINDYRMVNYLSAMNPNLEYYYWDDNQIKKTILDNNPFSVNGESGYVTLLRGVDNSYICRTLIGNNYNSYIISVSYDLQNKTILINSDQNVGYAGISKNNLYYGEIENGTYYVYSKSLINGDVTLKFQHTATGRQECEINNDFGYIHLEENNNFHMYITYDGGETFKEIKIPETSIIFAIPYKLKEIEIYAIYKDNGYNLYISRGREAGSGVVDEAFNTQSSYIKVSDGLLMQWGQTENLGTAAVNSNKIVDIAFADLPNGKAYSDNSYSVQFTMEGSTSGLELAVTNKTKDGFTIRGYNRNGQAAINNIIFHWMTIGSA